jgi:hypothetical protein
MQLTLMDVRYYAHSVWSTKTFKENSHISEKNFQITRLSALFEAKTEANAKGNKL